MDEAQNVPVPQDENGMNPTPIEETPATVAEEAPEAEVAPEAPEETPEA
jgi:hypothetical protein